MKLAANYKNSGILAEHINNYVLKCERLQNEELEKHTLENALPKIKGKLTKGKLRWRGIKKVVRHDSLTFDFPVLLTAIFQRDKRISPWTYISGPKFNT